MTSFMEEPLLDQAEEVNICVVDSKVEADESEKFQFQTYDMIPLNLKFTTLQMKNLIFICKTRPLL